MFSQAVSIKKDCTRCNKYQYTRGSFRNKQKLRLWMSTQEEIVAHEEVNGWVPDLTIKRIKCTEVFKDLNLPEEK